MASTTDSSGVAHLAGSIAVQACRHDFFSKRIEASLPRLRRRAVMNKWRISIGAGSIAAGALGAVAFGACTIGALAVGMLVIGKLKAASACFERVEIGELVVRKLTIHERTPNDESPQS